jgi:adenylate cyclase
MPGEIERKFLVRDQSWRKRVTASERLRDGLIATSNGRKVRVRIYEKRATIAIKSKRHGPARFEFEYEIPTADAEQLIAKHCDENVLTKTRFYVPHQEFTWEVDVYEGILSGVILAEVELERVDIEVPLPDWVGREVTNDPSYRKINMLKARLAKMRSSEPA